MRVKEFVSKLRGCDGMKGLVLIPGPGPSSGLYLKQPRHPESRDGYRWIAAVQSPSWFWGSMKNKDWFDKNGQYHRGWMTVLGLLVKQGLIAKRDAFKRFGHDWAVPGIYGKLTPYKGWNNSGDLESIQRNMNERLASL